MSVTLTRNRNGKLVPVKLSIWDAFKGVPIPKPRLHQCIACGRLHKPQCKDNAPAPKEPDKKEHGASNDGNFTAEEDAKIKKMKAENPACQWEDIAKALDGKHNKNAIRARYKQLQANEEPSKSTEDSSGKQNPKGQDKGKEKGKKKDEEEVKGATKEERKQQVKADGLKKQEELRLQKAAEEQKEKEKVESSTEKMVDPTSAVKTPGIVKSASKNTEDKNKWAAIASKYFDRTGKRMTLDQARQMAESST